jgi:hypothetical protein
MPPTVDDEVDDEVDERARTSRAMLLMMRQMMR